jgi:hypothetical protein
MENLQKFIKYLRSYELDVESIRNLEVKIILALVQDHISVWRAQMNGNYSCFAILA